MEGLTLTTPADGGAPTLVGEDGPSLIELAGMDPERLLADAGPALREALRRHLSAKPQGAIGSGFASFIDSDL
jgi:hypothetical protein